jgi:phage/plasmid-associated DNA primase
MLVAFGSDNLWTAEGRFRERSAIAWEIPAWLATPDTSIQKAVLLTGDGANGKSTYLRAVLAVAFGSDNLWTAEGRFRERS